MDIYAKIWNIQHQELNLNANYGLWVIIMGQCRSIDVINVPLWWAVLIRREAVHMQGRGFMENLVLSS